MRTRGAPFCDLCGRIENVTRVRIRITPDTAVETDLCALCQMSATAVEVIDAGRALRSRRPYEDVEAIRGELL
jgi:hypothetical protein